LLVHLGVVLLVLLSSFLRGCFMPRPTPDIVTYIDFGGSAAEVEVVKVAEPVVEPVPVPVEQPAPRLESTPVSKPKPTPAPEPAPKPAWKPTPVSEIRKGKRVEEVREPRRVSASEIEEALRLERRGGRSADAFADYYAQVRRLLFARWTPPVLREGGRAPVVRFEMNRSGEILGRSLVVRSGVKAYDDSVMEAARAVGRLPRPPADYAFGYVEVVFTVE
jgi:TonB family protein